MVWDIRVVVEIVAVVAVVLSQRRSPANRRRYAESGPHERDSPAPSAPVSQQEKSRGGCVVLVGICASVQHLLKSTAQCGCDGGCWMLVGI